MRITRPRSRVSNAASAEAKTSQNSVLMTYLPQQEYREGRPETIGISEGFGVYRTADATADNTLMRALALLVLGAVLGTAQNSSPPLVNLGRLSIARVFASGSNGSADSEKVLRGEERLRWWKHDH